MVLLVLALVWGALLISWLRSRSAHTFSDSVGTFRRHLTVLERATPTTVRPANRLREGRSAGGRGAAVRPGPIRGTRIDGPAGYPGPAQLAATTGAARLTRPVAGNSVALRRRQVQKRRRDVFFALLAGAVGSLILAAVPGMSVMWPVQVLFDLLLGGYVALLVRLRNLAAERELKLRFIPAARRTAARRPAYDVSPAYEFASGYGDFELRRAAN